ncbi:MAG: TonB-dependent receptor [Hyphomonadaceae bacterium]|nr:TonB-dependent receptor [Hyphomonadaceae bacterium]
MLHRMWVSAFALTTGFAGAAAAQEADFTAADEIVVTAQLREQRLIEVPMAVTAYSGETLQELGITKYDELALFVPGFEVQEQSANNTGFVIRGITSDSGDATTEPRIAVYQDGVSTSRNRGTYQELFDVERIEVSRGPQATLYGRGALIGAVNVIQNKADLSDPYFEAQLGGGEDGYRRGLVVLNAPLGDAFAIRVGGTLRARDGYVENLAGGEDLGGVDVAAGRIALAFEPNNALRFDLIGNIHNDANSGTAFRSGSFAPVGSDLSPYSPAALNTFGGFEGGAPLGLEREVRSLTLIGNWEISPTLSLTSITGTREFESTEVFDPDGSAYTLIVAAEDAEGTQESQEFRLSWDNGGPVSAFAGVSYFHEEASTRTPTMYDERYALAFAVGELPRGAQVYTPAEFDALVAPNLVAFLLNSQNIYDALNTAHTEYAVTSGETTSYEAFADATWRVTDRFELTAGVRYTQDEKRSGLFAATSSPSLLGNLLAYQFILPAQIDAANDAGDAALAAELTAQRNAVLGGLVPVLFSGDTSALQPYGLFTQPTAAIESEGDFDAWTWRLLGRYEFSDDVAGWVSYARGRRPEVLSLAPANLPGGGAPSNNALPAEQVDSYEVGLRAQNLGGGRLDAEGSLYYYDYTDFQTTQFVGVSLVTVNAGEATAYGFEGALNWTPIDHLNVFTTYAYNHARFESGARSGNSFRLSPDHSLSFGVRATFPISAGEFFVMPTYTWQSKIFFDDDNDRADLQGEPLPGLLDAGVDEFQDSYGLLNLRAGFEHESGHWALEGFINNALDEEYLIDAGNTGDSFTIPTFIRGAPRLVGLQVTARF